MIASDHRMSRVRLRRLLLILCPLVAAWTVIVRLTGGILLEVGSIRILSSRNPQNPTIMAIVCGLTAWALTPPADRLRLLLAARSWVVRMWRSVRAYIV